jgi:hypothetical protein
LRLRRAEKRNFAKSGFILAPDGKMSDQASKPLTDVEEQGQFVVDSGSDRDAAMLKRLRAHGITPGARLHITRSPHEDLVLQAGGVFKPLNLLDLSPARSGRIRSAD